MDKFWGKVMPECVADFDWGRELVNLNSQRRWEKSFGQVLVELDDDEFNLFLAKMVIKASGAGVVGFELTEKVTWLKDLRGRS